MAETTQLVVLGAGPGGYAAAFYAADLGMQVTLVDEEKNPGGVCLYRGCIPSKALLHVAKVIGEAKHAGNWGVTFSEPKVDIDKLRSFKQGVVDKLTAGVGGIAKMRKVTFMQGRATLTGPKSMSVAGPGGTKELQFEHLILATGSHPTKIPTLSLDSPRMMDSTSGLEVPDVPKSLLVIGGGYIGLELGTVYAALGSKVSVVEMTPGLLPGADRDLVAVLEKRLKTLFAAIMLNTKVVKVALANEGQGIAVTFEGDPKERREGVPADVAQKEQVFDRVLVAVGRRPNSQIPGLETTNVKVAANGFIETDEQRRTAEPNIFAIGDVAGEPMLAHKASHEARVAVEVIAGHKAVFEPQAIPAVVFTDPEIAWCGMTEAQAQTSGIEFEVAKFPWAALGRAITIDRPDGLTKLILEKGTGRILGVGVAGSGAGELIAEGVLAIEMGATAEDLKLVIHPHPTLSETLMESAEVFFGQSTHVYKPREEMMPFTLPSAPFSGRVLGSVLVSVFGVLGSAFAQLAPPGPVPTSAPGVSAEAQQHIEAARAAAGTMWEGVFQPVCNGAISLATPPAPRGGGAGRGGGGRGGGGRAGGPARDTWYAEPQKVFDNLYFVGQTEYSVWAITTSQGIIVLDAIYDYSVEAEVDEGLRKLGLNPTDIKYVIVSHGHGDHAAGAKYLQEKFGARLIMSAADYDMLDQQNPAWKPKRDMVATDGMKLTLGDFSMTLYLTPGHTEGTISTIFPVRDGNATHTVATWGGTLFNFGANRPRLVWSAQQAERFREIATKAGADVMLSNHTVYDGSKAKLPAVKARTAGQPNPYVIGADGVRRYLTTVGECAKAAVEIVPAQ